HTTKDPRASHRDQDRSAGVRRNAQFEIHRAQLICVALVQPIHSAKLNEVEIGAIAKSSRPQVASLSPSMQADQLVPNRMFSAVSVRGPKPQNCPRCRILKHFPKKSPFPLDGTPQRTIFVIPPEAGPEAFRGGSRTFGTANWNSILSRHDAQLFATANRLRIMVGARIEFFDARKRAATAGSLKSTYRVVNTTF